MDKITLTRTQLYDLVWSKTTTALAKDYGISDNSLRTICKKFNIPLPYAGYWAIIKHGKPARKVKLPTSFEGKDEIILNPPNENPEAIQKEVSIRTELIKEIESKHKRFLEVPTRIINPHPFITKAKEELNNHYTSRFVDHGLKCTNERSIYIKVAKESIPRALRFMDALITLLMARGHEIITDKDDIYPLIHGERLVIWLQQKMRCEDVNEGRFDWKTRHYYQTEIFMVRCWKEYHWHQKVWMDGTVSVENQLAKIIAGIEQIAKREKADRLRQQEYTRLAEEKRQTEKENQRQEQGRFDREELDGANFLKLLADSKKWKQAMILTEYIKTVEDKALLSVGISDELKEWLIWAKEKAERFNPIGL